MNPELVLPYLWIVKDLRQYKVVWDPEAVEAMSKQKSLWLAEEYRYWTHCSVGKKVLPCAGLCHKLYTF